MKNYTRILNELNSQINIVSHDQIQKLIAHIQNVGHIFLVGAGRSGIMINAFGNRLMHLGLSISIVGEISSPHSQKGDLMIIGSNSGETLRLVNQAKIAKANNVRIAVITSNSDSTLAKLADCTLLIPHNDNEHNSVQPMGTLFEQTTLIIYDGIILSLMDKMDENTQSMKQRHADIE